MNRAVRLTTLVLLLFATFGVQSASAGTYTVWSCRGPAGDAAPTGAWSGNGADSCASGGALRAIADHPGTLGSYRFEAPEGTAITGYRIWRYARAAGWGAYAALLQDPAAPPAGGCFAHFHCSVGNPAQPLAETNAVTRSGLRADALATAAACPGVCFDAEFRLFRAAIELTDASPPVLAAPASIDGGTVTLSASDTGGGLRDAQVLVDGAVVATATSGCVEPYTAAQPCPSTHTFNATVDTSALADGSHPLSVVVSDAAGNSATLATSTLTISRPAAAAPTPSPTPPPTLVQPAPPSTPAPAVDAPRGTARLTVTKRRFSLGGRARISGRVTAGGVAAAGVAVSVERRYYGPSARWTRVGSLTTDASGRFETRMPAVAQQLRFRAGSQTYMVDVVSRLRLSARPRPATVRNGGAITLSGRLDGAGPAARGTKVEIQALIAERWQTVATVRAAATGAFRWRYRFENTRLEALYSFRARVGSSSARWPWPATASARVKVHVIP